MKTILSRVANHLKSIFLSGLLILLPITCTIALFVFSFRILRSWLTPIYNMEPLYLQSIPGSEIILVIGMIMLIGAIIKIFLLESLIHYIENIFFKIPLMRPVYSGIKQLVQAFTVQDKLTFKKVVFVEFPRLGTYSIGFLTSEMPLKVRPRSDKRYFNVFIPTTPNPTSGFLVQVPENEIIPADMSRQEAMSLIISGGIVLPDRFVTPQE